MRSLHRLVRILWITKALPFLGDRLLKRGWLTVCLSHALVAQQSIELGFTTAEGFERFHRRAAATDF